jgi:hypothetical protein
MLFGAMSHFTREGAMEVSPLIADARPATFYGLSRQGGPGSIWECSFLEANGYQGWLTAALPSDTVEQDSQVSRPRSAALRCGIVLPCSHCFAPGVVRLVS